MEIMVDPCKFTYSTALTLALYFSSVLLLSATAVAQRRPPYSCDASDPATKYRAFCKASLPIAERVDDLISRLTLEEKISQLGDKAPAIPRLGVPAYLWWSESLHGISYSGPGVHFDGVIKSATSFPQVILTAASFDSLLWYRIGQAIGTEARAMYNVGQATGMTFWSPNINIFRDPRWGRGQETPGEDPTMNAKYAVAYVRGLQGEPYGGGSWFRLKTSACCKHFTAYDLENWKGHTRYTFDARVSAQDLEDTYQPPFKRCVEEGHASGIMCSYNRVNGVPTCADYRLLTSTARWSWRFTGYIASDCDAVSIIHDAQGYAKTPQDAVADVLKAGMDLNCGSYLQNHTKAAIWMKKLSESDVNRALHHLFSVRMRLGLFDGNPKDHNFGDIGPSQVCTARHQYLALEAARDGIVLLKNSDKILPLHKSRFSSLGVIGPNANNARTLLGNYAGPTCKSVATPLSALRDHVRNVRFVSGCDTVACASASIGEAVQVAGSVDQVVMFMGLDQTQERETQDRVDLVLPGLQQNLITSVARAAKRPVVLVLLCGGPVDVSFAKFDDKIGGILWAGYPGEAGAQAIVEVLFGTHNPGGRLPMTWYPQEFTRVPMTDMSMRPHAASSYPGRTYRFYTGKAVFHFGYGLSYSTYSHKFVSVTTDKVYLNGSSSAALRAGGAGTATYDVEDIGTDACESLRFAAVVGVENKGRMAGKHPVLLFGLRADGKAGSPRKQLLAFDSVRLDAGERTNVTFVVSPCEHLSRAESDGSKVLDGGVHSLLVDDDEYKINVFV